MRMWHVGDYILTCGVKRGPLSRRVRVIGRVDPGGYLGGSVGSHVGFECGRIVRDILDGGRIMLTLFVVLGWVLASAARAKGLSVERVHQTITNALVADVVIVLIAVIAVMESPDAMLLLTQVLGAMFGFGG